VIGLTTGICLAEAGLRVLIAAAEPPQQSTSIAAGAVWGPHLVGHDDRIARWGQVTLDRFAELAGSRPDKRSVAGLTGIVHTATGITASREEHASPPEFAPDPGALTAADPDEIPAGYRSAWRLSAPLIAMPEYLDYLAGRFGRAGGASTFPASFGSLSDASRLAQGARVIVNCTGTGARDLVPDASVTPVRGQAVVVANPGITEFFVGTGSDPGDLTYFFPHREVVVLGGTEQPGDCRREPDPATAERIVAACTAVQPALRGARVLGHRVGLRPARPSVRLEAEQLRADLTVIHNYGHGGAGVTLSWGCAADAAALALAVLDPGR
jgi:D-amino-acid oxidase